MLNPNASDNSSGIENAFARTDTDFENYFAGDGQVAEDSFEDTFNDGGGEAGGQTFEDTLGETLSSGPSFEEEFTVE